MTAISIVIPSRENENPYETLRSLANQIYYQEVVVVVVYDEGNGANWARNRGAELSKSKYLLFSDNDIIWEPKAIDRLHFEINSHPEAGYCYGWYEMDDRQYCKQPFSETVLRKANYISTMSMIRREVFPGFDESLQRLQDWDLWLTLLERGVKGAYCPHKIFTTTKREGITYGDGISWEKAREIVLEKHGLPR